MRKVLVSGILLTIVILSGSVVANENLRIEGSTTVGPIVDAFAQAFDTIHPDLDIMVNPTGSGNGAKALIEGRCDIAMMSRFMKASEFENAIENGVYPVVHVVALDGVCIVVHPSNRVGKLTTQQVQDIYSGKIINWKELGGIDSEIIVVSRDTSSGTYEVFEKEVMHGKDMAQHVQYVAGNPEAYNSVRTTPSAISYVGYGFLDRHVKTVEIDGVIPNPRTIAKGAYPVARPLYLFTDGYPELGTLEYQFCTFYLSEDGQAIIEEKGFVPLTDY